MGSASQIITGLSVILHPECKNLKIKKVMDVDINPNLEITKAQNKGGVNMKGELDRNTWGSVDKLNIAIQTTSFSGSTHFTTGVRLDKK